jgi:hypothetical protein
MASMKGADSMSPTVPPSCSQDGADISASFLTHDKAAYLDYADVRLLVGLVDGQLGNALNPVLNLVGEVRDDLEVESTVRARNLSPPSPSAGYLAPEQSFQGSPLVARGTKPKSELERQHSPELETTAGDRTDLFLNDSLVDLSSGQVVLFGEGDVEVSLVVSCGGKAEEGS